MYAKSFKQIKWLVSFGILISPVFLLIGPVWFFILPSLFLVGTGLFAFTLNDYMRNEAYPSEPLKFKRMAGSMGLLWFGIANFVYVALLITSFDGFCGFSIPGYGGTSHR